MMIMMMTYYSAPHLVLFWRRLKQNFEN